jgi:hypothetical protein
MVESSLHEKPGEFLASAVSLDEGCDVQSVLPQDDGSFRCHCTCGGWDVIAATRDAGLRVAEEHTTATALARAKLSG